jgi:hypothetical protein
VETTAPAPLAVILGIALGIPFFIGFWIFVTSLLASLSGWTELANIFAANVTPTAPPLRRHSVIKVGRVSEKNVTALRPAAEGLYLTSNPLFRFRRPALLIPWNRIRYVETHRMLWQRSYTLDLGGITTIRVRDWVAPALRQHGVDIPEENAA